MSTACACQRSSSEMAGKSPSATPGAGSDSCSRSAGRRRRHLISTTHPHPGCDPRRPRRRRTDRLANQHLHLVSRRPGPVSRIGHLSRGPRRPRRGNHPGSSHHRDQIGPRSSRPDHSAHLDRAGRHNRNRPNSDRAHRQHHPRCPLNDLPRSGLHNHPRRRHPGNRNRNRPNIGPGRRRPGRKPRSPRDNHSSNAWPVP